MEAAELARLSALSIGASPRCSADAPARPAKQQSLQLGRDAAARWPIGVVAPSVYLLPPKRRRRDKLASAAFITPRCKLSHY